jgi:hypothetical protein
METRKLEEKDFVGYIPNSVYLHYLKNDEFEIRLIVLFDRNAGYFQTDMCLFRDIVYEKHLPKLVLRPLSDLYRTITHNGKDIVPMVELAKICSNIYFENCYLSNGREVVKAKYAEFWYNKNACAFRITSEEINYVNNQYQLFDYLHELKIDYRGLIDSGLAIDANTLENNPYK